MSFDWPDYYFPKMSAYEQAIYGKTNNKGGNDVKRGQMKAFDAPKCELKLKSIRVENEDGEELTVCPKCQGRGKIIARENGDAPCPECKGAGMRRVGQ